MTSTCSLDYLYSLWRRCYSDLKFPIDLILELESRNTDPVFDFLISLWNKIKHFNNNSKTPNNSTFSALICSWIDRRPSFNNAHYNDACMRCDKNLALLHFHCNWLCVIKISLQTNTIHPSSGVLLRWTIFKTFTTDVRPTLISSRLDFIIKNFHSVLILIIADKTLNDSLCCSCKYICIYLCRCIGQLYILINLSEICI